LFFPHEERFSLAFHPLGGVPVFSWRMDLALPFFDVRTERFGFRGTPLPLLPPYISAWVSFSIVGSPLPSDSTSFSPEYTHPGDRTFTGVTIIVLCLPSFSCSFSPRTARCSPYQLRLPTPPGPRYFPPPVVFPMPSDPGFLF